MDNIKIRQLAEKILNKDLSNVEIIETDGVFAEIKDGRKVVGGATVPQILRAISLLTLNENKTEFTIKQYPKFKKLGVMLDMSRGGVMRVEKVKEYISQLAMFGANELLLYTEDIYTLEDYPHFGYCRGVYTDNELREIDDYAYSLNVEIIPCIQTLGHMEQYLSWEVETNRITDTSKVLLCDNEETYTFIEAEIAKMRKVFRSNEIHIGMDEANDVGLGNYLRKNGFVDRYDLLKRHLSKVIEICKKYDFSPMMWSDMFFRLGSPTDEYYIYDGEFNFPENVVADVPDCKMVYWDYYNDTEFAYQNMIRLHKQLGQPLVFAGGNWVWDGFLPDYKMTVKTMLPALKVCRNEQVENVFATMWGDDGCETDYFRAMYAFAYFSEYCYSNDEPTEKQIEEMGTLISKKTKTYIDAVSNFHSEKHGKYLVWGDIFYNLSGIDFSLDENFNKYTQSDDYSAIVEDEYADVLFKIVDLKAKVYSKFQTDYKCGKNLSIYADEIFPQLIGLYERLYELNKENWYDINKAFGFEEIEARYAATIFRLKSAINTVRNYICGKSKVIEELEYTAVYGEDRGFYYRKMAFPKN